jgi:large-conductance mechanosensitive channel
MQLRKGEFNDRINTRYRGSGTFNCVIRYESMNTAIVNIGLAMQIFVIVFSLKRAKEKRKAWEAEREKIKEYGEKINEETRNRDK